MKRYTFTNGYQITSNLTANEVLERMNRLDWLRVLAKGYEDGEGKSICEKAVKAYNKKDNFTGIIRLTVLEKDFLGYMLENEFNTDKDIEVIRFYIR